MVLNWDWGDFSHQGDSHPCLDTFLMVKIQAQGEVLLSSKENPGILLDKAQGGPPIKHYHPKMSIADIFETLRRRAQYTMPAFEFWVPPA